MFFNTAGLKELSLINIRTICACNPRGQAGHLKLSQVISTFPCKLTVVDNKESSLYISTNVLYMNMLSTLIPYPDFRCTSTRTLPSAGFITASWSNVAMLPAMPAKQEKKRSVLHSSVLDRGQSLP